MATIHKRVKKKKARIHPRWMGMLRNAQKEYEKSKVVLFCVQCDDSTDHFPVRRFVHQIRNKLIATDEPTARDCLYLKCNRCGNEVKNIRKGAYHGTIKPSKKGKKLNRAIQTLERLKREKALT